MNIAPCKLTKLCTKKIKVFLYKNIRIYNIFRSGGRCIVNKKEFRLVRLAFPYNNNSEQIGAQNRSATSQLGIFIARQDQPDIGCHGYFVKHLIFTINVYLLKL